MNKIAANKGLFVQILIVVIISALIVNVSSSFANYVMSPSADYSQTVIVIDAGHGDFDPGAIAHDGTLEKDLNLHIALKLADFFRANGFTVVMTRTDDVTMTGNGPSEATSRKRNDTQNRAALSDSFSNAVMISIHQNAFSDRSQHGTQIFYGQKNEHSKAIAEAIQASMARYLQPDNERKCKRGYDSIYILKTVENPLVMIECGFITNRDELELLKDSEYQQKLAFCIFLGYIDYLNAQLVEQSMEVSELLK